MPLADSFNQVVCMDLKEHIHNESWILHLIDAATRYSAACLITSKKRDTIISSIFKIWISYFGAPRMFMSDNGGEFANEDFKVMCEKLNIDVANTAGESPFSNGIVERHNLVIGEAMKKTLTDLNTDPEIALAWAVSAKNALHNQGGYSPNQLVFGCNPNVPSVLTDKLPALEECTSNDIIRKNIEALHHARENFIQTQSSEKIRRALRHNVRTYVDVQYENGEKVFYRRKNFKGWKGPGTVIGLEGKIVLVRHGSTYYRVHPCQLMKAKGGTKSTENLNVHGETVSSELLNAIESQSEAILEDNDSDGCVIDENAVQQDEQGESSSTDSNEGNNVDEQAEELWDNSQSLHVGLLRVEQVEALGGFSP